MVVGKCMGDNADAEKRTCRQRADPEHFERQPGRRHNQQSMALLLTELTSVSVGQTVRPNPRTPVVARRAHLYDRGHRR